jgi:4-amino-4-deoxy-L-arabinose transferase-like glycosyltransferase
MAGARRADGAVCALVVMSAFAWGLAILLGRFPGFYFHDTADAIMWSRNGFILDTPVHPPVLLWLLHTAETFVPLNNTSTMVIAIGLILVGVFSVWRIAILAIGRERAVLAVVLCGFLPYFTWIGLRLNHNTLMVALWPLCVWVFLECLRKPTVWRGVAFGAVAALGVLSKYFFGLLLISMVIVSILSPRRYRFYASPGPYAAVAVFLVLVAPYVYAAFLAHDGPIVARSSHQRLHPLAHAIRHDVAAGSIRRMLIENVLALGLTVIGFLVLLRLEPRRPGVGTKRHAGLLRLLLLLSLLPYAMTIGLTFVLRLEARGDWTGPILTLAPVVLAYFLAVPSPDTRRALSRLCVAACVIGPFLGWCVLIVNFAMGNRWAVMPYVELARKASSIWSSATGEPLRILSGDVRTGVSGILGLPRGPAFDGFGREVARERIDREGMLILCTPADEACHARARALAPQAPRCSVSEHRTLLFMKGPSFQITAYLIPPAKVDVRSDVLMERCGQS